MNHYPIEDTIIAYFDGRLSDEESAELLHRVSVSPEIRQVFREQEMLRDFATTAARNVSVRPEVESALFSRIAAMQEEERIAAAPLVSASKNVGMRRGALAALLLVLLAAGTALHYGGSGEKSPTAPASRSINGSTASQSASVAAEASQSAATNSVSSTASQSMITDAPVAMASGNTLRARNQGLQNTTRSSASIAAGSPGIQQTSTNDPAVSVVSTDIIDGNITALGSRDANMSAVLEPDQFLHAHLMASDLSESYSRFELGWETSTGFNSPADRGSVAPLSEQRVHAGYFVGAHDQVGLRLTSGLYQTLTESRSVGLAGSYAAISRSNEAVRQFGEEVYYLHRFDIGGLMLDGSAAAGLLDAGWSATIEASVKWPLSSHLLTGVSFSLSRVHSNAPTAQDLMGEETSMPVIVSGSDVRNTLNGRIQYGLSYRF